MRCVAYVEGSSRAKNQLDSVSHGTPNCDRQADRQTDTRPSLVPLQHSVARVKTTHFGPLHVRCIVLLLVSISSNRTSLDVNMFRAAHLHLCMIAPQTQASVLD